jgi:hypothetical protein
MLLIGLSELALPRTNALPAFTSDALSSKMLLQHLKATNASFFSIFTRARGRGGAPKKPDQVKLTK